MCIAFATRHGKVSGSQNLRLSLLMGLRLSFGNLCRRQMFPFDGSGPGTLRFWLRRLRTADSLREKG